MDKNTGGSGMLTHVCESSNRDSTAAAKFIFRYVFISVALWVPAVVRRTSRKLPSAPLPLSVSDLLTTDFYYVQKGIWYDKRDHNHCVTEHDVAGH
jgi:hypothetical protein